MWQKITCKISPKEVSIKQRTETWKLFALGQLLMASNKLPWSDHQYMQPTELRHWLKFVKYFITFLTVFSENCPNLPWIPLVCLVIFGCSSSSAWHGAARPPTQHGWHVLLASVLIPNERDRNQPCLRWRPQGSKRSLGGIDWGDIGRISLLV